MTNTQKPSYTGHRARMRQKFARGGLDAFLEHEVLEFLLTYALPRKDTKPLAWALLKRFGSLDGVLDAPPEKLLEVDGIGPNAAQLIALVRALFSRYARTQINEPVSLSSPAKLIAYCKASLQGYDEEVLELIFLSVRNTIITTKVIASGLIDRVVISPRKIVECALHAKATAIILVHNHPSGDATPSQADVDLTNQTRRAAKIFNIGLHDHIIIGKNNYFSLRAPNLIED